MTIGLFTYYPSHFIIHFTNGAEEISWNDIESVFAYKVDWFAFDDVHIDLIVKGQIISVREDIDGFDAFIQNSHKQLPGLKSYLVVINPPFATNLTMLYDRFGRTQKAVEEIYYKN